MNKCKPIIQHHPIGLLPDPHIYHAKSLWDICAVCGYHHGSSRVESLADGQGEDAGAMVGFKSDSQRSGQALGLEPREPRPKAPLSHWRIIHIMQR